MKADNTSCIKAMSQFNLCNLDQALDARNSALCPSQTTGKVFVKLPV